jgi:hypothetical protein
MPVAGDPPKGGILRKVLIGVGVFAGLAAVLAGYVAMQPGAFHYERETLVTAPPEVVFPLINDFHAWKDWSPWAKLDPNQKTTYEGATSGLGAVQSWDGDDEVGAGRMTITESKPYGLIKIKLEFLRPFAAVNQSAFNLDQTGNQVRVKWTLDGNNNFGAKAAGLFMDMKAMIEADFDKGLADIKRLAEAEATKRAEEAKKKAEEAAALQAKIAQLTADAQAAAASAAAAAPGAVPAPPAPTP